MSPVAKQPPAVAAVDVPSQQEGNVEGPLSPKQKSSFTAKLVENDSKEEEDDESDSDTDDDDDDGIVHYSYLLCKLFLF